MTILEELKTRAAIAASRQASAKAELVAQGDKDERDLLAITESLDEHPDEYDGPCLCKTCRSYGD